METTEEKLEDLSNNELLILIKTYEIDYERIKQNMLKDFDKMVEIEEQFDKANKLLLKRLKG